MYTLKNLRNMMKNHTGMLVLLVISMFVSFGVLFFGVGLYYQYSKNIEDGEIDSYAVGFSINDIITKKNFCEFVKNMPNKLMGDVSYITCFSSTQVSGIDEEIPVAFYLQYSEGKFEYSDKVFQPMIDDLVIKDGSFFTQEQYSNGEKKAVVMGSGNVNQPTSAPEYTNSVTAFGQSYDVIGTCFIFSKIVISISPFLRKNLRNGVSPLRRQIMIYGPTPISCTKFCTAQYL